VLVRISHDPLIDGETAPGKDVRIGYRVDPERDRGASRGQRTAVTVVTGPSSCLPRRSQPGSGPPPIASPDGFAYASLFLSLVWLVGLGSLLGVIFGHISRMRAKRNGLERSGLATAGTVLGWVGLAATVLVIPMGFI
jgi:hypothetical protein